MDAFQGRPGTIRTCSLFLDFSGHVSNVNTGILNRQPHSSVPLFIHLFRIYLLSIYCVALALISKNLPQSWGEQDEHPRKTFGE